MEKGCAAASLDGAVGDRRHDAVQGGEPAFVGPARHHVAEIDQQGVVGGLYIVPTVIGADDLETGDLVRPQDSDDAVVGVFAHTGEFVVEIHGARRQRVVVHPQDVEGVVGEPGEVARRQFEGVGEDGGEGSRDPRGVCEIGLHGCAEAGNLCRPEIFGVVARGQLDLRIGGRGDAHIECLEVIVHAGSGCDAEAQAEALALGR